MSWTRASLGRCLSNLTLTAGSSKSPAQASSGVEGRNPRQSSFPGLFWSWQAGPHILTDEMTPEHKDGVAVQDSRTLNQSSVKGYWPATQENKVLSLPSWVWRVWLNCLLIHAEPHLHRLLSTQSQKGEKTKADWLTGCTQTATYIPFLSF